MIMEFWQFPRNSKLLRYTQSEFDSRLKNSEKSPGHLSMCSSIREWMRERCPYYNLYPKIIPLLEDLDAGDVSVLDFVPPLRQLAIQLPKSHLGVPCDSRIAGEPVRALYWANAVQDGKPTTCIAIDLGETTESGSPLLRSRGWRQGSSRPIRSMMDAYEANVDGLGDVFKGAVRLLSSLLKISKDPDLVQPDVLAKDRIKFQETKDQACVDRAHRRGKRGWTIGQALEKIPHFRRPHLARFWVGPGRKFSIVRLRKGAIVHRKKVTEMPSGYSEEEMFQLRV